MQGGALWRRPCGCSSHARMGGKRKRPARATGPRCRGGTQVFACPIDRRLRRCARVGTQHLFVVACRRSCAVSDASELGGAAPAAVLCERARCVRRAGWRARALCCAVASVAVAAAACVLRLSWWRARVAWRMRAWRLRGARAGCCGGVRLASCGRCGRRARGFPCSCARDVVDAAAGRRCRGHGHVPRGEWSVFMALYTIVQYREATFLAPFSRVFSQRTKRTVLYVSLAFSKKFLAALI